MHRISSLPADSNSADFTLIEQPSAPILFLSSATSDITALSSALNDSSNSHSEFKAFFKALPLSQLNHPAQIDHYLSTTAKNAKVVLIRLLGSRGHWSYGLDQFSLWQNQGKERDLIIVSGTLENSTELNPLSSINIKVVNLLSNLLRLGGFKNITSVIQILYSISRGLDIEVSKFKIDSHPDPFRWNWKNLPFERVGVVLYNSLLRSNDVEYANTLLSNMEKIGICPRLLWVSSLRDERIQNLIIKEFINEEVNAVITSTSFASINSSTIEFSHLLWDRLNVPIFQLLSCSTTKKEWESSSLGISPTDLSLQIVLPEIDGRIITRPCAFKTLETIDYDLSTSISKLQPNHDAINWSILYIKNWLNLQKIRNQDKKISIIIANYPVKDGRIANGVGLDTPKSLLNILNWLKQDGYFLGGSEIPKKTTDLIDTILSARTNSKESLINPPLDYISLEDYNMFWKNLDIQARNIILRRWGEPQFSDELEERGFPIHGIQFGNISILIQPARGYDPDRIDDLHNPELPPPHRYLAQYLWLDTYFNSNAIIHLGKHGSLEWLPGKGIGLSSSCFPHVCLPPLPNIYPFIVNDPGEGSQAKRRSQAVIIDHLPPPLGRAGVHNNQIELESLLDEYYESKILSPKRANHISKNIVTLLIKESWPESDRFKDLKEIDYKDLDNYLKQVDSYLCEIKDTQIRLGLHSLGELPDKKQLTELVLAISRPPCLNEYGLTQFISKYLGFSLDPWNDNGADPISKKDQEHFNSLVGYKVNKKGKIIDFIEEQSIVIIDYFLTTRINIESLSDIRRKLAKPLLSLLDTNKSIPTINKLNNTIIPKVLGSIQKEKSSLLDALNGIRIQSGPSGSPTKGKLEVLPTGRNFFSVDIRGLPTESAWQLGRVSAQNILDLYLQETGEHLKSLALSVWGTATMRNGGEDISQLLALIGVAPIWDGPTRRITDLEVIPLSILQRPRVDVTLRISGLFRDAFPQLVELVNKALEMVSILDEPEKMNPYAYSLNNGGSTARVFGSAPGSYGAGLQEIINSGAWNDRSELADSYMAWSKWIYKDASKPKEDKNALSDALKNIQVVMHNQDNREHDILDSDDYYQFHGGLASAVEQLTGNKPKVWFSDNSRTSKPILSTLQKEIDKVVRSRLLNPKWIKGMKKHGFKGAFEMGASIDYLFAYDATTNLVPDWCYKSILNEWLKDNSTYNFLQDNNPWVLRDIAERLLEASNRGLWSTANKSDLEDIKKIVNSSEAYIETKYSNDLSS